MRPICAWMIAALALLLPADSLHAEVVYSWRDCVIEARKNHPDLKAARAKIEQARASYGIARSVYLPQINVSVGMTRSYNEYNETDAESSSQSSSSVFGSGVSNSGTTTDSYSYGFTARQLVFDGLKSVYDIRYSRAKVAEAEYQYRGVSASVRLDLRTAFVQLLKAQDLIVITEEIVKLRKKNSDLVHMRYKAGREHRGAYLVARANLSQAEFEHAQALRNVIIARRQLVKEMGLQTYYPIAARGELEPAPYGKTPDFVELVRANPLMRKAITQKESARFNRDAALANLSPRIDLFGGANRSGSRWAPQNYGWHIGIEATYPLFEGGKSYYQAKKAQAELKQVIADALGTQEKLLVQLELRWNALMNETDRIKVQGDFLKASEERSRIAEMQYNVGFVQFDNWIIIVDDFVRAKKNLLEAKTSALLAEAEWMYARGEMLSYDR
ncbi:MAG TPA: TolC family protein [Spirochaetota bacterium]|nr:TolC family protein [Spirochaetota bacterium]HNT10827.1 TolC family protein [Spirochaetota bacterium]HOS41667.1 TolC family protein [Spirochaetota bacterium]